MSQFRGQKRAMTEQYTQTQLLQIVAEVEALAKRRDAELDREQVQSILQELHLPPNLLDEAMVQLQRREAIAVQRRRNRWIAVGAVVVVGGAIATTAIALHNQQQTFARISAYQDYIGLVGDRNSPLTLVNRQMNPDVEYRVTLQNVPQGRKLDLQCNWLDPNGQSAHQNRYQTRRIDKEVWPTHCHYQMNATTLPGTWQVQMLSRARVLSHHSFEVR